MLRSLALYPIEPIGLGVSFRSSNNSYFVTCVPFASGGIRTHARRPELESGALDHSATLALGVSFRSSNNSFFRYRDSNPGQRIESPLS